jgi:hypothetical protein
MSDIFTGERNTSRVLAAPGGKQSINIFGGDDVPEPVKKPAPVSTMTGAAGARVEVRSEHSDHLASGHMSSRVLAAPGGKSSLNLFSEVPESVPAGKVPAEQLTKKAAPVQESFTGAAGARVAVRNEHTDHLSDGHMSSRVLAAPGGNSSLNLFAPDATAEPTPLMASSKMGVQPVLKKGAPEVDLTGAAGGRVAVRTEHMGISTDGHMSSRVLAAPGGASSMAQIVGGSTASDRIAMMKARRQASNEALGDATNTLA